MTAWFRSLICAALALGFAAAASAQDQPDYLGVNDAWYGFRYVENGNPVCYMASQPQDTEYSQPVSSRGDSYILITHRPAEGTQDVVSFYAGFPFQDGSSVTVTIDGQDQFALFTSGETAWPEDASADRALVDSMLAGGEMVVRSTSARGTVVTDTYSLFGATATRNMINEACGL